MQYYSSKVIVLCVDEAICAADASDVPPEIQASVSSFQRFDLPLVRCESCIYRGYCAQVDQAPREAALE